MRYPPCAQGHGTAQSLKKPGRRACRADIFFRICAKHRLFSMLFRRRVELAGIIVMLMPALTNPSRRFNMAKKNAAPTKSEILASISKDTELSKKQVGA